MTSVPSTVGIVASGEDVLNDAVFWVDAGRSSVVSGALSNLGTGGSALNAVFGNSTGVDSFDPQLLTHTGSNYMYLPGLISNFASTPSNAPLNLTDDCQFVFRVSTPTWSAAQLLLAKPFSTGGYYVSLSATTIDFVYSLAVTPTVLSSASVTWDRSAVAANTVLWIRLTRASSTGAVTLDYAADQPSEPTTWTTVGNSGARPSGAIAINTNVLGIGGNSSSSNWTGVFYRTIVRHNGTTVFDADFTTGITSGAQTTFTESSANAATVTINRSTSGRKAVAVTRPILLFGTDDYLEVPDNDLLDFGASEPFTVAVITRQWNTITSQGAAIAKKTGNGTTGTGWLIRNGVGTPADTVFDTYDGTTGTNRTAPTSKTSGALCVITGIASSSQLTAYFNNTASAATTRQAGGYANSEVMRIGRLSGASTQYVDMELVAAAVWRRALNANEIATIVARYT